MSCANAMILYLDTSSLLKCLIDEAHTADVLKWVDAADAVATSRVTFPEAAAALSRRQRLGDLTGEAARVALRHLARRWDGFMLVDIAEIRAGGLATRHLLRGFDAVQLAAALTVRTAVGVRGIAFSSFDRALCRAAAHGRADRPRARRLTRSRRRARMRSGAAGAQCSRSAGSFQAATTDLTPGRPPMSGPAHPIDAALFDPETAASDDFYRHVNGGWLDANPIPPEYGAWGAGQMVHEHNQAILRRLLEEAAGRDDPKGSAGQKVGDYFAAAMDETAIAAAGVRPLEPYLSRIAAAGSVDDVRELVRDLQRVGVSALHALGVAPDFEDSEAYLVYLGQDGLGLPERDYYTRDDEQSEALRRKYVTHVARQLANLGVDEGPAGRGGRAGAGGGEARRPRPSSPSRPAWPRRRTPPRSCATCR